MAKVGPVENLADIGTGSAVFVKHRLRKKTTCLLKQQSKHPCKTNPKSMEFQCKFYQNATQNQLKIDPKSIKMGVRRRSGGRLTKRPPKVPLLDASVMDFGSQSEGQIEVKID